MSNSVAEAYLLIVRESNVPIFGEAVPVPFTGQIELDGWSWEIKNKEADDRKTKGDDGESEGADKKGESKGSGTTAKETEKAEPIKPDTLIREVKAVQERKGMLQKAKDEKIVQLIKKAVTGYNDDASSDNSADEKKKDNKPTEMKLKFEKGADLATTPLLYALARGDVIPKAVLTLFHRATSVPVTLVITMGTVRITNYTLTCDPDDKMADIKESWEATYQTVDWMYQNRPAASGPNLLTQGTVRVFAMKQKLLPF